MWCACFFCVRMRGLYWLYRATARAWQVDSSVMLSAAKHLGGHGERPYAALRVTRKGHLRLMRIWRPRGSSGSWTRGSEVTYIVNISLRLVIFLPKVFELMMPCLGGRSTSRGRHAMLRCSTTMRSPVTAKYLLIHFSSAYFNSKE
jgi:hypothetical protein